MGLKHTNASIAQFTKKRKRARSPLSLEISGFVPSLQRRNRRNTNLLSGSGKHAQVRCLAFPEWWRENSLQRRNRRNSNLLSGSGKHAQVRCLAFPGWWRENSLQRRNRRNTNLLSGVGCSITNLSPGGIPHRSGGRAARAAGTAAGFRRCLPGPYPG